MTLVAKTAENALLILGRLAEVESASVAQLSEQLGLNRTVVHRLVATLEKHGYVRCENGSCRLGFTLLRLAGAVEFNVRSAAQTDMERLADQTGETCVLVVREGLQGVIADQRFSGSEAGPQIRYPAGFRNPLTTSGHGRAILAFSDAAVVTQSLAELAEEDRERLTSQLAQVRRQGYAESTNELRSGTSGLAAPVCDSRGSAVASVGVVSPASRFPDVDGLIAATTSAARRIEIRLFG